jgi:hypothetical protein
MAGITNDQDMATLFRARLGPSVIEKQIGSGSGL